MAWTETVLVDELAEGERQVVRDTHTDPFCVAAGTLFARSRLPGGGAMWLPS
jgi:hypothetical protein